MKSELYKKGFKLGYKIGAKKNPPRELTDKESLEGYRDGYKCACDEINYAFEAYYSME